MGFSSVDSFIIAFSTRDPRSGGIAARRCFILGHPGEAVLEESYLYLWHSIGRSIFMAPIVIHDIVR